jgi:hypothetical protein
LKIETENNFWNSSGKLSKRVENNEDASNQEEKGQNNKINQLFLFFLSAKYGKMSKR